MQKETDFQVQEAQGPQRGPHQDTLYLEWKKLKIENIQVHMEHSPGQITY